MKIPDCKYPRKYFHMKRRLAKAAKWSAQLKDLCAATCDARTALEAEAYEAVMQANLTVQNEDWANAAARFMHAREIYEQLSAGGGDGFTVVGHDFYERIIRLRQEERAARRAN